MRAHVTFLLLVALSFFRNTASAQLTVRIDAYGSKLGYVDNATLVVEPHGAYVAQSLYLSYADHNQYPGSSLVEIVHRFKLPANAVVNDLWLWIGDSAVKAVMMDTWTARSIYDSIVSKHRDPAFLSKSGELYELHVYPLVSGSVRKIRLNFIAPVRWAGMDASAELPLKMLQNNNAPVKPVRIQFKEVDSVWNGPSILELPQAVFRSQTDSAGIKYKVADLADVGTISSLSLGFTTQFVDNVLFSSSDIRNEGTYFQLGFNPGSLFGLAMDSSSKRILIGVDLSGAHAKNSTTLIPNIRSLLTAVSKPDDSLRIIVAGAGKIAPLNPGWLVGSEDSINATIDRFAASDWGDQVFREKLPTVLYADKLSQTCWQFPGLQDLATVVSSTSLVDALPHVLDADVVAAYEQGFESAGQTQSHLAEIVARIDTFFTRGGRLLTYYDYNRVGKEVLGTHYIPGLTTARRPDGSLTLYRNTAGNIGKYFPESFVHYGVDFLRYTPDPDVKVEVQDFAGNPVIISKKVRNGLLIISAIWSFEDDGALKGLIGVPLLGLNVTAKPQMLTGLLGTVRSTCGETRFNRAIVLSNTDSLFQQNDVPAWAKSYVDGFSSVPPPLTTINLLDGSIYLPPYITDQQVQYYGSGFLLKNIANATHGSHFETHLDPWNSICSNLSAYAVPVADSMTVTASVDSGNGTLKELREVAPRPEDPNKARFFIGSTTPATTITFNISAVFSGVPGVKLSAQSIVLNHDTTQMDNVVPAMLGNEHLNEMFTASVRDTAAIVQLAMKYHLLCDYTSLIALEPKDTTKNPKQPTDEGTPKTDVPKDPLVTDSLSLAAYPNPFNSQTTILVSVGKPSIVRVTIYNILGQRVRDIALNEAIAGTVRYRWNGTNNDNRNVSSGIYFLHAVAKETSSGATHTMFRKIMLLK